MHIGMNIYLNGMQNAWNIIIIAQPISFKRDYNLQKSLSMMLDKFYQGEGD